MIFFLCTMCSSLWSLKHPPESRAKKPVVPARLFLEDLAEPVVDMGIFTDPTFSLSILSLVYPANHRDTLLFSWWTNDSYTFFVVPVSYPIPVPRA
ncbi:uncharacterized protein EV420DRAFT_249432 [Desarmillaria tabescens]|uniref:Uncharacterized protein n=1 Tax=Armillaria tabescens TaxID=1929756 RepID=A0AA39KIT4_ARMTA|nr:uncharacterized protein EV420DRAFT_249432 [Desarmillaria tabescens]KAK0460063.1 hypothetical protein EV420DRAFT_249432 [Desarmillaria tabescens]